MDIFWAMYHHGRVVSAEHGAREASRVATQADIEVLALNKRVEKLSLACQALWEIIREHGELSDNELLAKMQEVDLRGDGGSGKPGVVRCPACGRNSSKQRANCIYCELPLGKEHPFE